MAANNLRIVYKNLADLSTTTVTASTAASPVSNLLKDSKSSVWRSTTDATNAVAATLTVLLGTNPFKIGVVALPFTNLTSAATIQVKGFSTNSVPGTQVFDTGAVLCCPWNVLDTASWTPDAINVSRYAYGGGTYAVVWIPPAMQVDIRALTIDIRDTRTGVDKYVEAAKLVIGQYWSPNYNTSYGLSATVRDLSENERTESGDLITRRRPSYNSINFDLKVLDGNDRLEFTRIMIGNGKFKPVFISLFPEAGTTTALREKERSHTVYGKLVQVPGLENFALDYYSSKIEIEEV